MRGIHIQDQAQVFGESLAAMLVVQRVVESVEVIPGPTGPSTLTNGLGDHSTYQAFAYDGSWHRVGEIAASGDEAFASQSRAWRWGSGLLVAPVGTVQQAALCDGARWRIARLPEGLGAAQWLDVQHTTAGDRVVSFRTMETPSSDCLRSGPLAVRRVMEFSARTLRSTNDTLEDAGAPITYVPTPPEDARCWSASNLRVSRAGTDLLVAWQWCHVQWNGDSGSVGPCRLGAVRFDGAQWRGLSTSERVDAGQASGYAVGLRPAPA